MSDIWWRCSRVLRSSDIVEKAAKVVFAPERRKCGSASGQAAEKKPVILNGAEASQSAVEGQLTPGGAGTGTSTPVNPAVLRRRPTARNKAAEGFDATRLAALLAPLREASREATATFPCCHGKTGSSIRRSDVSPICQYSFRPKCSRFCDTHGKAVANASCPPGKMSEPQSNAGVVKWQTQRT